MTTHAKSYEDPGNLNQQTRREFLANVTIAMTSVISLVIAAPLVAGTIPSASLLSAGRSWSTLKGTNWRALTPRSLPAQISFTRTIRDGYMPPANENDYVWGVRMDGAEIARMHAERPDLFKNAAGEVHYPVVTMGFIMFSPICPHLGCKYSWNSALGRFLCPCHGSQYLRNGRHVAGPAARGLDPLPLREYDGRAQVMWIRYKAAIPDRIIIGYS